MDSINTSIPDTLRELLAKLEYLTMCPLNSKACFNDMTFVPADSWVGAFKRGMAGEGRRSLILHLNNIIDTAVRALEQYKNTSFLPLIVNKLANSKGGIANLIKTYETSPDTVSKLKVCLENIDIQLKSYLHLLSNVPVMATNSTLKAPTPPKPVLRVRESSESSPDGPPLPSGLKMYD